MIKINADRTQMGNVGVGESFYFRDILSLAELKFTFMPDVVFFSNCKLLLESSFLQLDTYSIQKIQDINEVLKTRVINETFR